MKQIALGMLAVLGLVACGGNTGTEESSDEATATVTQGLTCSTPRTLLAHAVNTTNEYALPGGALNHSVCFTFANPMFATNELVTSMGFVVDNPSVVGYWTLYPTTSGTNGGVQTNCASAISGKAILAGGRAATEVVLPADVGLKVSEPYLTLHILYNNPSPATTDGSGAVFCTTTQPRPNIAGVVKMGTDNLFIPGQVANHVGGIGTCSNLTTTQPVYAIDTGPMMHRLGTGIRTEHIRPGTTLPHLLNVPNGTFRFDASQHFSLNRREIRPGDTLRTTCTYSNPNPGFVPFGIGANDEQCYDYMVVYPIAAARRTCGQGITF